MNIMAPTFLSPHTHADVSYIIYQYVSQFYVLGVFNIVSMHCTTMVILGYDIFDISDISDMREPF